MNICDLPIDVLVLLLRWSGPISPLQYTNTLFRTLSLEFEYPAEKCHKIAAAIYNDDSHLYFRLVNRIEIPILCYLREASKHAGALIMADLLNKLEEKNLICGPVLTDVFNDVVARDDEKIVKLILQSSLKEKLQPQNWGLIESSKNGNIEMFRLILSSDVTSKSFQFLHILSNIIDEDDIEMFKLYFPYVQHSYDFSKIFEKKLIISRASQIAEYLKNEVHQAYDIRSIVYLLNQQYYESIESLNYFRNLFNL